MVTGQRLGLSGISSAILGTFDSSPASSHSVVHRRGFVGGLAAAATLGVLGCGKRSSGLRFSGIPDGDKRDLKVRYDAVAKYLAAAVGQAVEYVHVPDYTAAVTALATRKIDFAWLGGVTTVQAEQRTPGGVHFIAARESDLRFRSYLIANAEVARTLSLPSRDQRTPQDLDALAKLAGSLRGRKFSFGAKSSTSGHIMPRAFLTDSKVGINPDTDFDGGPTYQLKGGHAATLRTVASGAVDFGVLNFAVWEAAEQALQQSAPVVYVTPQYVDYCLVAHKGISDADAQRLRAAFTDLDTAIADQQEVLTAFSAKRFVEVDPTAWDGIRKVLAALDSSGEL